MEKKQTQKQTTNKKMKGLIIGLSVLAGLGIAGSITGTVIALNKNSGGSSETELTKEHTITIDTAEQTTSKYVVKVFKKGTTTETAKAKKGDEVTFVVTSNKTSNALLPTFIKINNSSYQLIKSSTEDKWEVTVKIEFVDNMKVTVAEQDVTNTFTVTFKDGDTTLSTQTVVENQQAIKPQDPTKADYTFVNWYENKEGTGSPFDFKQNINAPITLYAIWSTDFAPTNPKCPKAITFKAIENSYIQLNNGECESKIFYSYTGDDDTWTEATVTNINLPKDGYLYLKGDNSSGLSDDDEYYWTFKISGKCNVGGSVMGLLYNGAEPTESEPQTTIPNQYCFYELFYESTGLNKISKTFLPATTLKNYCYNEMFYGCTSLTIAPELLAENLADSCYSSMFYGCTSLTTAPKLPAENLANSCYSSMFYGCTSLTIAPELLAENLANSCYSSMFYRCTSLTTAPELPAENLARNCYNRMFQQCYALTSVPELPATTLAEGCYTSMFADCSSIKVIEGDTTTVENKIFTCPNHSLESPVNYMFSKCQFSTTWASGTQGTPFIGKTYSWVSYK